MREGGERVCVCVSDVDEFTQFQLQDVRVNVAGKRSCADVTASIF